jgi:hypothetical protein
MHGEKVRNRIWFKISSIITAIALIVGVSFYALYPRVSVSANSDFLSISVGLNQNEVIKAPEQQLPANYYDPVTTSNSPTTNSGLWANPLNAYADGTNYTSITSGSPSTAQIYGGYGFNLTGNVIQSVKVGFDAYNLEIL